MATAAMAKCAIVCKKSIEHIKKSECTSVEFVCVGGITLSHSRQKPIDIHIEPSFTLRPERKKRKKKKQKAMKTMTTAATATAAAPRTHGNIV